MVENIKKFVNYIRSLPLSYKVFSIILPLMLLPALIQVDCPICGDIEERVSKQEQEALAVSEISGQLVDYTVNHGWCANRYVTADYDIRLDITNTSSQKISMPLLIWGEMPEVILNVHAAALGNKAKLVNVEFLPGESKIIDESLHLWAVGLAITKSILTQAEFSVITNPTKIIANCPLCGGTRKVTFAEAVLTNQ